MTEEKDWRDMLADLKAEVAKEADQRSRDWKNADAWGVRLNEVFNSKAANRFFPALLPSARRAHDDILQQGFALTGEIMEKIVKKELTTAELNLIAAEARDLAPVDSTMFGMLQPVALAAFKALEIAMEEENPRMDAWYKEIGDKEVAVFRRYLAQQPGVAPALAAMISPDNTIPELATIAERIGHPVGPKELRGLAEQVNDIFGNTHGMPVVSVFRTPKREFQGLPSATITDDQCRFHFGMSGSKEVRAAVFEAAEKQKPPAPAPKTPDP